MLITGEGNALACGENLVIIELHSMIELNTTEYKKSLLFFTFKLQLIGIHAPILGWSVTVFLTLAVSTFLFSMKFISLLLTFTLSLLSSLSVQKLCSHLSLLPNLLLGLLTDLLSEPLLPPFLLCIMIYY